MSVRVQWFCDICNPSRQVRDETHEIKHGFAEIASIRATEATDNTALAQMPEGWSIVAQVPRTGVPGHACPHCHRQALGPAVVDRAELFGGIPTHEDRAELVRERTRSGGAPVAGPDGWPSKASPFASANA